MDTMILYGSRYGHARRYAEKLSEQTGFPAVSYLEKPDLSNQKMIVYLGGLYAGGVRGLSKTLRSLSLQTGQILILATVGLADTTKPENWENICRSLQRQLPDELFDKAKEKGYEKFTDMALHFYELIQFIIRNTPQDVIVYFLHHTETEDGRIRAKTVGKMLNEKLTLEGLFSIVLLCRTDGQVHHFITQSDGTTTAKSPMEMFPLQIDNDLKLVDDTIRDYYGFQKFEIEKEK